MRSYHCKEETLTVEVGVPPLVAHHFIEFLIVDYKPVYHRALSQHALKDLWSVTSVLIYV